MDNDNSKDAKVLKIKLNFANKLPVTSCFGYMSMDDKEIARTVPKARVADVEVDGKRETSRVVAAVAEYPRGFPDSSPVELVDVGEFYDADGTKVDSTAKVNLKNWKEAEPIKKVVPVFACDVIPTGGAGIRDMGEAHEEVDPVAVAEERMDALDVDEGMAD